MRKVLTFAYYVFAVIMTIGVISLAIDLDLDIYSLLSWGMTFVGTYLIATSNEKS